MAFFQCYESSPFKVSTKELGSLTQQKKTYEGFMSSLAIVGFSCTCWGILLSSIWITFLLEQF
jgi:hypothetical protein